MEALELVGVGRIQRHLAPDAGERRVHVGICELRIARRRTVQLSDLGDF